MIWKSIQTFAPAANQPIKIENLYYQELVEIPSNRPRSKLKNLNINKKEEIQNESENSGKR